MGPHKEEINLQRNNNVFTKYDEEKPQSLFDEYMK